MRTHLLLSIGKKETELSVNQQMAGYTVYEDIKTGQHTYVGDVDALLSLSETESDSFERICLAHNDIASQADYPDTMDHHITFRMVKSEEQNNFNALMTLLKRSKHIRELRIPICTVYTGLPQMGSSSHAWVDPFFDSIEGLPTLTTLHINWSDMPEMAKLHLLERLSRNKTLREVNVYQHVFVEHGKPFKESYKSYFKKLLDIPEDKRPIELSNDAIATLMQTCQYLNGKHDQRFDNTLIGKIANLLEMKSELSRDVVDAIKKLLEVPMSQSMVEGVKSLIDQRRSELTIWFHGYSLGDKEFKDLMLACKQSAVFSHVPVIHTQNATVNTERGLLVLRGVEPHADLVEVSLEPETEPVEQRRSVHFMFKKKDAQLLNNNDNNRTTVVRSMCALL